MLMYFDFNGILTIATLVAGLVILAERWIFKPRRAIGQVNESKLAEYARAFFPVFLLVLGLRVLVAEPYRIPSGSMKPTLLEGEFILANKFIYGIRLPIFGTKIIGFSSPKRGDIVVFRSPQNPEEMNFIKRIVGLPGDKISYQQKVLYINGEPQQQEVIGKDFDSEPNGYVWRVKRSKEFLGDKVHDIYVRSGTGFEQKEITVPEGHYFAMGDNRDNSEDSRSWGFVSDKYLIGKATYVWMSWDSANNAVRWNRLGQHISKT